MSGARISLNQQIEEVRTELDYRARVYERLVRKGEMRQSVADYRTARMEAVLRTLQWLEVNQAAVVEVAANKAAEAQR